MRGIQWLEVYGTNLYWLTICCCWNSRRDHFTWRSRFRLYLIQRLSNLLRGTCWVILIRGNSGGLQNAVESVFIKFQDFSWLRQGSSGLIISHPENLDKPADCLKLHQIDGPQIGKDGLPENSQCYFQLLPSSGISSCDRHQKFGYQNSLSHSFDSHSVEHLRIKLILLLGVHDISDRVFLQYRELCHTIIVRSFS